MGIEVFSPHHDTDFFDRAEPCSKPDGYFISEGKECPTRQCKHCGRHWPWVKGSGKKRGFCVNCMGITCGRKECDACTHHLKKLDEYDQGTRALPF